MVIVTVMMMVIATRDCDNDWCSMDDRMTHGDVDVDGGGDRTVTGGSGSGNDNDNL